MSHILVETQLSDKRSKYNCYTKEILVSYFITFISRKSLRTENGCRRLSLPPFSNDTFSDKQQIFRIKNFYLTTFVATVLVFICNKWNTLGKI